MVCKMLQIVVQVLAFSSLKLSSFLSLNSANFSYTAVIFILIPFTTSAFNENKQCCT